MIIHTSHAKLIHITNNLYKDPSNDKLYRDNGPDPLHRGPRPVHRFTEENPHNDN